MKAPGFYEAQLVQILTALRGGKSYDEAVQPFVATVEPKAVEANRGWLTQKAKEQLEAAKPKPVPSVKR